MVEDDSPQSLAKALIKALSDKDWLKQASIEAKENARTMFSIESATSKFVDLYATIDTESEIKKQNIVMPKHDPEAPVNLYVYVDDRNEKRPTSLCCKT